MMLPRLQGEAKIDARCNHVRARQKQSTCEQSFLKPRPGSVISNRARLKSPWATSHPFLASPLQYTSLHPVTSPETRQNCWLIPGVNDILSRGEEKFSLAAV